MNISDHDFFMREALREAEKASERGEVPVGALVVCRGRIVGRAHNLSESLQDPTAHAEMQAITSACNSLNSRYLTECTLYVTLEPCCMCAGGLFWAQIGGIVYGASDPKRGFGKLAPEIFPAKMQITSGILVQDCERILKDFFKKLR